MRLFLIGLMAALAAAIAVAVASMAYTPCTNCGVGPVSTTNLSGTVATGGTFQQIQAAGPRNSLDVQNRSGNGDKCYLFFGPTASATTAKSILLTDGNGYLRSKGAVPADAIQITCTTNGDAFYAAVQ